MPFLLCRRLFSGLALAGASLALALLSVAPARAQGEEPAPPGAARIGPWRLVCGTDAMTDRQSCRLVHSQWVEPPGAGQAGLALEVIERGGRFVPAVTAREMGMAGAARGLLALSGKAQIRFAPKAMAEMPCALEGRSLICAPLEADAARLAEELRGADHVLLRVQGLGSDTGEVPMNLPLAETEAALKKFREGNPAAAAAAPEPPFGGPMVQMLIQKFREFFFQ